MGIFSFLTGQGGKEEINELRKKGAAIIDVRTNAEFARGHVPGSANIPLQELKHRLPEIKAMQQPVITICQSGARSGRAAGMLKQEGIEAVNGGSWLSFR